jgi:outer membrane protein
MSRRHFRVRKPLKTHMRAKHQATKKNFDQGNKNQVMKNFMKTGGNLISLLGVKDSVLCFALVVFSLTGTCVSAAAQNRPTTTATPVGTTAQPNQPGSLPPAQTNLPPNSGTSPVRPSNEAQQSTQPQSNLDQQRQQTAPNTNQQQTAPGTQPTTATPVGTSAPTAGTTNTPATGGAGQTPGQNIGVSSGIAPAQLPDDPPPIAPGYEAPERPLPSAERVGVDTTAQTPLTLEDAVRFALENNNDIDTARINVQLSEFDLTAARGVYDPIISSESFYERSVRPVSSTIGGGANGSTTQTDFTGSFRFGGFSPFGGGAYQVDFASARLTTNNRFVTLNPQFPTAAVITYTQPLWRGFRFDDRRRRIEIARRNVSLSDAQFRQQVIDVIAQIENAYWDLAFALRSLQVQLDAVRQARIQVESNRRQVAQGTLAPIDVVAADAQVTTFEQSVYSAQEAVTRAENVLKTLMLPDRTNPLWQQALVPISPIDLAPPRVTLETAVAGALQSRPEIAQLQTQAEINRIDTRFFRDQTRPQIDLVGTYNPVGLAGTFVPRESNPIGGGDNSDTAIFNRINELSARAGLEPLLSPTPTTSTVNENLVGGYGTSLGNLIGNDYPTVRVGVRVQLPLRNRTAQANLGRSLAAGTQIQNLRAQLEQLIEADVRNTLQSVRSAEARLAAAASSRSSAEQQYASEQRQFAAGTSTLFLVLQRQTELIAARGRELQAQTDLNKSIALFQRATGNTLAVNNVSIRSDVPAVRQLEMQTNTSPRSTQTGATNGASLRPVLGFTDERVVMTPAAAPSANTPTSGRSTPTVNNSTIPGAQPTSSETSIRGASSNNGAATGNNNAPSDQRTPSSRTISISITNDEITVTDRLPASPAQSGRP